VHLFLCLHVFKLLNLFLTKLNVVKRPYTFPMMTCRPPPSNKDSKKGEGKERETEETEEEVTDEEEDEDEEKDDDNDEEEDEVEKVKKGKEEKEKGQEKKEGKGKGKGKGKDKKKVKEEEDVTMIDDIVKQGANEREEMGESDEEMEVQEIPKPHSGSKSLKRRRGDLALEEMPVKKAKVVAETKPRTREQVI
jgi:hypothetical protein